MSDKNMIEWRFGIAGNIKAQHSGENGEIFYGTKCFSGGTKVYISDVTLDVENRTISVLGRNRYGRYVTERTPIELIENVRVKRIFAPKIIGIMNHLELMDGWVWRERTGEDRRAVKEFVKMWNKLMDGEI